MIAGTFRVRPASPPDAEVLSEIRRDRELWLAAQGIEQWGVGLVSTEQVRDQIDAGEWFVGLEDDDAVIGGLRYLATDEDVWPDAVDDGARYVHGLMTARSRATSGTGAALLSWAEERAVDDGARTMRLDCVESNRRLCDFYRSQGYQVVGRRDFPGPWFSATLFEKHLAVDITRREQRRPRLHRRAT